MRLPLLRSSLLLLAVGGAFFVGREMAAHEVHPVAAARSPAPPARTYEVRDPNAPLWAPQSRWVIPEVGSIFRNRFSVARSPLDGVEAVLLSPLETECLTGCPLALRQVDRETSTATLGGMFQSLGPDLAALFKAEGLPPAIATHLRAAAAALAADALTPSPPVDRPPLRALFVGMPRPDYGPGAWSVGVSLTNLPDPHFDRTRGAGVAREGWRILLSRVEAYEAEGPRPKMLAGALLVGRSISTGWERPVPETAPQLGAAFGSLWGHFGGLPKDVVGLFVDKDCRVFTFGSDLALGPLADSPSLARALKALLRRA